MMVWEKATEKCKLPRWGGFGESEVVVDAGAVFADGAEILAEGHVDGGGLVGVQSCDVGEVVVAGESGGIVGDHIHGQQALDGAQSFGPIFGFTFFFQGEHADVSDHRFRSFLLDGPSITKTLSFASISCGRI